MIGKTRGIGETVQILENTMRTRVRCKIYYANLLACRLPPSAQILGNFVRKAYLAAGKEKKTPPGWRAQRSVPGCPRLPLAVGEHVGALAGLLGA
jgi:hypothetical protein